MRTFCLLFFPNPLHWDKTSRKRFEANQARLQMGVLAYNLLHLIRQFYVWGEEVKRSLDWLSKRLLKVGGQGFLPCPAVVCPYHLGLSPGAPLPGDAGLGFIGLPAEEHLVTAGGVCQKSVKNCFCARICAILPPARRMGCENLTVGEILPGHRGPQDHFETGPDKSAA